MDEEDRLSNLCADVVSLARFEPALVYLFRSKAVGEWVQVAELYRLADVTGVGIKPELVAARLSSPSGTAESAIILFCDEELQWSLTAYYNVAWLFREAITPAAVPGPVR